ncbi:MAG: AI-2E family transporter [Phycisphaera sp.]|nr:AI-2E family transporter [Phycisphaera sp.]
MVDPIIRRSTGGQTMMVLAAFVVVVAGMKAASSIVVPILAAVFVAVVSLPPTAMLVRFGIRRWLATLTVFFVVMLVGLAAAAIITSTATALAAEIPQYQELLQVKIDSAVEWLETKGLRLGGAAGTENESSPTADGVRGATVVGAAQIGQLTDLDVLFPYIQRTLNTLVGLLQDTVFVLLTVVFILMEVTAIPTKVRMIAKQSAGDATLERWRHVLGDLQGYLVVKTFTSAATGLIAGVGCWCLGLPYAVVFGLIAFVLNYVPSLGSIIASIPPILVALVLEGAGTAIGVMVLYLTINIGIGSLTEPRIMGRRMGLSPLVVFLSLVFWGFILGPVGMFLSVPLTMIVKILLEGTEDLSWIAVILGPGDPKDIRSENRIGTEESSRAFLN